MKKELTIKQNTLYNTMGSSIYLVCQWLITVLVVKFGSVETAGILSLAMAITNVFNTIALYNIRVYLVSDYNNQYSVCDYTMTRIVTCLLAVLCCVLVTVGMYHYSGETLVSIILFMGFRVTEAFADLLQGIQQKANRMDYIGISYAIRGLLTLGAFCSLLAITDKLSWAIIGMMAVTLCVNGFYDLPACIRLLSQSSELTFNLGRISQLIKKCFPLMISVLFLTATVSIPRTFLERISGSYELGIYASVATPTVIAQSAVGWLYNPLLTSFTEYYNEKKEKEYKALYKRTWKVIVIVFIALIAGCALLGKWGLSILFPEEIVQCSYLLIPAMGATMLIASSYFLNDLLIVSRNTKTIVLANGLSVVLTAIVSYPMIHMFGMNGVNFSIYVGQVTAIIVMIVLLHRKLSIHFLSE